MLSFCLLAFPAMITGATSGKLTHYWDCAAPSCSENNPTAPWTTTTSQYTFTSTKSFTKLCQQDQVTEWTFDSTSSWSSSVDASLWTTKQIDVNSDGQPIYAYPFGLGNKDWCPAPVGVFKDSNEDYLPLQNGQIVKEDPPQFEYQCADMNPWKEADMWYGFVAVGGSVMNQECGRCLKISGLAGGDELTVQVINIGDGQHDNLDLLVAGGGTGAYPEACSAMWKGDLFTRGSGQCVTNGGSDCALYGGFSNQDSCNTQFEQWSPNSAATQTAQDACNNVLFGPWFAERGDPDITYEEVDCSLNLICKSKMYPDGWTLDDIQSNCGSAPASTTAGETTTDGPTTTASETTAGPTTTADQSTTAPATVHGVNSVHI